MSSLGTRIRDYLLPPSLTHLAPTIAKWTFAAILLRVLIVPITGSRDLSVTAWISLVLLDKHQLIQSNDPPIIFIFFAGILGLFGPLIPSQIKSFYISNRNYNPSEVMHILALAQPGIQQLLFVVKLPFFFFDFAIGIMLLHLIDDPKRAILGYKLWLFNPVSIVVSYAIGQYDIIATFFIVSSLFLYKKRKEKSTALALGIAAATKAVGLLLLLPYAIFRSRDASLHTLRQRVFKFFETLLLGLVPPILSAIALQLIPPYYESANLAMPAIYQNGFYGLTLWNRGYIGSSLLQGIETFVLTYSISFQTGAADTFFVLPLLYIGLLLVLAHFKGWTFGTMRDAFLIFLLLYYALDTFHAQWFLWVQPLLILVLVSYYGKLRNAYWASCALFFTYLLKFGPFLTVGLFVPIYPQAMEVGITLLPTIVTVSFRMLLSIVLLYTALLIFWERWGPALRWQIRPRIETQVRPACLAA